MNIMNIKPHIDDEIFRVREFMNELMKVQDSKYKASRTSSLYCR